MLVFLIPFFFLLFNEHKLSYLPTFHEIRNPSRTSTTGAYKYSNVNIYGGLEEILSLRLIYGTGCVSCDMSGEEALTFYVQYL